MKENKHMRILYYFLFFMVFYLGCKITDIPNNCKETRIGKQLVSNISNSNFEISMHYMPTIALKRKDSTIEKLLSDSDFRCDIYWGLYDIDKTIICHLLLTDLTSQDGIILDTQYLYTEDQITEVNLNVNSLSWIWELNTEEHSVSKANQLAIIRYWQKILAY